MPGKSSTWNAVILRRIGANESSRVSCPIKYPPLSHIPRDTHREVRTQEFVTAWTRYLINCSAPLSILEFQPYTEKNLQKNYRASPVIL